MRERFLSLWKRSNARGDGVTQFGELTLHYEGEARRAYHKLRHIEHCLDECDEVMHLLQNPIAVGFTLWYHDFFQELEGDNELASAELARDVMIEAGIAPIRALRTFELILDTRHRKGIVPKTLDGKYVVDIDLAIFGQSVERFEEYGEQVRQEYIHVPEDTFRRVRVGILEGFEEGIIYHTQHFQLKYEEQAHRNLRSSIAALHS